MKEKIFERMNDALFLWDSDRKESALFLVLVTVASISKIRYPQKTDGDAFRSVVQDFRTITISVEYRGKLETIEQIFYKWIRCNFVHEGGVPNDIEIKEDKDRGAMSVRAGGAPNYILQIGTGWFYHLLNSVKKSKEYLNQ